MSCAELAQLKCVFIIALGRTGSTHLLRLLNSIEGYRLSGETDNAWVYLGWWHGGRSSSHKLRELSMHRDTAAALKTPQGVLPTTSVSSRTPSRDEHTLCALRQLMLIAHNPVPRARVFGFKEIYSPFVRDGDALVEVFTQGVGFIRTLFPNARFVFHSRRNLSRVADSDFWGRDRSRDERLRRMSLTVRAYAEYVASHPDHAYATTLEGITDRNNITELTGLFTFLGEPLTARLRRVARSHPPLYDWAEQKHTRRIVLRDASGAAVGVKKQSYAYRGSTSSK